MMSCKEVAERASALIDGELGVFDLLQLRLHLAMCRGCGEFIRQMRTTSDLTKSAAGLITPNVDDDDARISAIFSLLHKEKQTGL